MNTYEQDSRTIALTVLAEIAEVDRSKLRGDDRLREDLGMDSLSSLELLSTIGEKLDLDLMIEDAMDIRTVDDACAFVESQCRARA
ncbi:Acyl carrier protein [Labilithrix luteola]|uniref:Acyl carrier protein n=1 Tax=Labilithrix luteola TaxID=1391654 RepID=A0A0K1PR14_9BACT|nr:acyl carrier protein [Labilithrix luteola]AKU95816.1 Acyl carrier protein [Labilithrix luteola]